jgi:hypothetical protein
MCVSQLLCDHETGRTLKKGREGFPAFTAKERMI